MVTVVVGGLLTLVITLGFGSRPHRPIVVDPSVLVAAEPVSQQIGSSASGPRAATTWVRSTSAKTGIGIIAVQAYGDASLRLGREQPGCHLGWTTLAGIGGIESGHGTHSGASVQASGVTTHPILGPALNGTSGMAAIRSDEQSAKWHGDPRWDHAVGPMQFIPSTWRKWGSDGDGDGIADPNNIYDAAYAAGRYLCASGDDLRTSRGWSAAIFSYNHSNDYVRNVLARAARYA